MQKPKNKTILVSVIIFLMIVVAAFCFYRYEVFVTPQDLHGTFVCQDPPHGTMSFNKTKNEFFLYFYGNTTLNEHGFYTKIDDTRYLLNSDYFENTEITYSRGAITIMIDGAEYVFQKTSDAVTKADYARNPSRLGEARFPLPHARYAAHRVDTRR